LKFITLQGKKDDDEILDPQYLKLIMSQDKLLEVFTKSLVIHLPKGNQIQELLFCTSGLKEMDELFNSLKSIALECFNTLLEYIQAYPRIPREPEVNKFYSFMRSVGARFILDSVTVFCTRFEDLDGILDVRIFTHCVL